MSFALNSQVDMSHQVESLNPGDRVVHQEVAFGQAGASSSEELLGHWVIRLQLEVVQGTHGQDDKDEGEFMHEQHRRIRSHVAMRANRVDTVE